MGSFGPLSGGVDQALTIVLEHVPTPAFVIAARRVVAANRIGMVWLAETTTHRSLLLNRTGPDALRFGVTPFYCGSTQCQLAILKPDELPPTRPRWNLTRRETQVVELIANGATNRQIAATLDCALRTVEHHVSSVLRKVGVENRTALIAALLGR